MYVALVDAVTASLQAGRECSLIVTRGAGPIGIGLPAGPLRTLLSVLALLLVTLPVLRISIQVADASCVRARGAVATRCATWDRIATVGRGRRFIGVAGLRGA